MTVSTARMTYAINNLYRNMLTSEIW